eukprot:CAMPEP_0197395064 /NCGR_PEP_ID=MMETSP1165-20131217/6315_1 /TAXON_ID=284809 /ORGANISM="Chrysocystis fragilis, Strain CCMP3189" /LENGTH=274 /DNA_ID=CAMNT_0042920811 /DNA_START=447 /DNA_END=1268 /DNA_ORIENTATION=+
MARVFRFGSGRFGSDRGRRALAEARGGATEGVVWLPKVVAAVGGVGGIHGVSPSFIHLGLLLARLLRDGAQVLAELGRDRAMIFSPMASVDLEERPDAAARVAAAALRAALRVDDAALGVVEEELHLGAVGEFAVGVVAAVGVLDELHVELDEPLPVGPLLLLGLAAADGGHAERLLLGEGVLLRPVARLAEAEVLVLLARPVVASVDVLLAVRADRGELGHLRVVHVVERHHRRVLGAAQLVELVVVPLAQVEEQLAGVVKVGLDDLVAVARL